MSMGKDQAYAAPFAYPVAAAAAEWERTVFIRRTYTHLLGAVAVFAGVEAFLLTAIPEQTLNQLVGTLLSGWNWLLVLGAFLVVSWIAESWANSATSMTRQYLGLGLYTVAQAVIFLPLLWMAHRLGMARGENIIGMAAVTTGIVFGGLTLLVFITRADFSWLGRFLWLAGLAALAYIACSILFGGFGLGGLFVVLMIGLASGYILYYTSSVLYHFRTDQYVAAALALFASVALLFWYILQLYMRRD